MKLPKWATALDVFAVVMAFVTLSVLVFGGFRITTDYIRLSVMDWWRPALWGAIAIAMRHALVRQRPLPGRVTGAVVRWWRSPDTRTVLPIHLATRTSVLVVGFLAVIMIGFPSAGVSRWVIYNNDLLDLPARWDAGWYLAIANNGYAFDAGLRPQLEQNIAFFPAFPMAVRYASTFLGRETLWAGVVVAWVAFYAGLVYFLRLARDELGDGGQAETAVMLLAAYPFAVFFSVGYTEGLFLLSLVGAVYHYRHEQLWRAAGWGLVCGLTRPNGFLLSITLGLMAVSPMWDARRWRAILPPPTGWPSIGKRLLSAAAPGVGMLTYSAFIYQLTGHPFQWAMQNVAWGRVYRSLDSLVWDRVSEIEKFGFYHYLTTQTVDFLYVLTVILVLGTVWPIYRRFGLPYAVLLLATLLPPMAAGGLMSIGRVTSVMFPVFLWMGGAVPARHRTAWIAGFAGLQALMAVMFFTWRPVF